MEKKPVSKVRGRLPLGLAVLGLLILVLVIIGLATQQQHQPPDSVAGNTALKAVSNGNINPTSTFAPPPTVVAAYAAPQSTPDYADSFLATMVAIKQTLPTPSPVPGWPADKQSFFSGPYLSGKASLTALALDPPPPAYSIPNATARFVAHTASTYENSRGRCT